MKHLIQMSKVGSIFSLFFFAVLLSCNKEKAKEETIITEKKYLKVNDVSITEALEQIASFKLNSNSRSTEEYSIENAIWFIEAISNSNHGHARMHHSKLFQTNHQLNLIVTNNQVTNYEVQSKINEITQIVNNELTALNYPNEIKKVVTIDVEGYFSTINSIVLEVNLSIGLFPQFCPNCSTMEFIMSCQDDVNSWNAVFNNGTCNTPPSGPSTGDAGILIQNILNSQNVQYGCQLVPNGYGDAAYNGYFINIQKTPYMFPFVYPNPNDQIPNDGIRDFLLFFTSNTSPSGYNICLPPSETLFYRNSAVSVIGNQLANLLPGKEFSHCSIMSDGIAGQVQALHKFSTTGGVFVP